MEGKDPVGGQWNYDHDNRKALDQRQTPTPPSWPLDSITRDVINLSMIGSLSILVFWTQTGSCGL